MADNRENAAPAPFQSWRLLKHWAWVMALGGLLVILGVIAIAMSVAAAPGSVRAAAWFLLVSGLLQTLHTFSHPARTNAGNDLLNAISYVILGAVILSNPVVGPREAALLLSLFFLILGVYRVVTAGVADIGGRSAAFVAGIVALFLGIHLWVVWMDAGLWLVSFYVGIEIAVSGLSLIIRGLSEKHAY